MPKPAPQVLALHIGRPRPFREDGTQSAIARAVVDGPVALGPLGFDGDEVADKANHGGPDKAVHLYPHDHYAYWRRHLGDHALLRSTGAFGENLTTRGLIESEVRVGDRFRLGTALVEVSHGRQPCWKLDHRFGVSGKQGVMAEIVRTGRCGLYLRVLEPGRVRAGDTLKLVEPGPAQWTVDRVFRLLIAGGHRDEPEALDALARLPVLAQSWRERAARLADA